MKTITVTERYDEVLEVRVNGILDSRWSKDWIADLDTKTEEHTLANLMGSLSREDATYALNTMKSLL